MKQFLAIVVELELSVHIESKRGGGGGRGGSHHSKPVHTTPNQTLIHYTYIIASEATRVHTQHYSSTTCSSRIPRNEMLEQAS